MPVKLVSLAVLVVSLAIVLAACGGDDGGADVPTPAEPAAVETDPTEPAEPTRDEPSPSEPASAPEDSAAQAERITVAVGDDSCTVTTSDALTSDPVAIGMTVVNETSGLPGVQAGLFLLSELTLAGVEADAAEANAKIERGEDVGPPPEGIESKGTVTVDGGSGVSQEGKALLNEPGQYFVYCFHPPLPGGTADQPSKLLVSDPFEAG